MRAPVLAVAALVVSLAVAAIATGADRGTRADPVVFEGLGTWIDVYDGSILRQPEQLATRIAARGIRTVYVETANYRVTTDIANLDAVGRLVDGLHAAGVRVVAWTLPGFQQPRKDLRRALTMVSFRTPSGEQFDGVALDIEALGLADTAKRTARMLDLLGQLRTAAGGMPVAAITYPPRMLERHLGWWPSFPWSEIAGLVDAVIPMAYTGGAFHGYDETYGYVTRSLKLLRRAIGPELAVHVAGGVPNRMTPDELKALVDAISDDGTVDGWSLYDLATTTDAGWSAIGAVGSAP
jgi:hypothetical protein